MRLTLGAAILKVFFFYPHPVPNELGGYVNVTVWNNKHSKLLKIYILN